MAYAPGETVPHDGEVRCVQHPDVVATVTREHPFPTAGHFGENEACAWEYVKPEA